MFDNLAYNNILRQIACVENPVYQSYLGKYFIGQSQLLNFGFEGYALGFLYNPKTSSSNLYLSTFTVTNTSNLPIKARIYANSTIPARTTKVTEITPTNLTIIPPPKPKIKFLTCEFYTEKIKGGIKLYTRIIPPNSTLVSEENGKIIIPPGGNILISLVPPGNELIKADIAYGWWEEEI